MGVRLQFALVISTPPIGSVKGPDKCGGSDVGCGLTARSTRTCLRRGSIFLFGSRAGSGPVTLIVTSAYTFSDARFRPTVLSAVGTLRTFGKTSLPDWAMLPEYSR